MNNQKEQYVHICGRRGMSFAVWLYFRLAEQGMKAILADCSTSRSLITYASGLHGVNGVVVSAEKWTVEYMPARYVIFYHEQEDLYTDLAEGVYLLFTEQRNLLYIKMLLEKLTGGKLCLFEPALLPQLQEGRRTYLLVLYDRHAAGEYYIPAALSEEVPGPFEDQFLQIFLKSVLSYLSC